MKLLSATLTTLTILTSCSQPKNTLTVSPSIPVVQSPIVANSPTLPQTPQKTCGDPLPNNAMAYPISFYPVIVDYSQKNFNLVKKHFCEDALKRFSQKAKKEIIQVGSFTSQVRAINFKNELAKYFVGVEVGEATIVKPSSTESLTDTATVSTVMKAAKLTSEQADELKKIVGGGKDFKSQHVVVVPTDIPDGFKVTRFATLKQEHPSPRFQGGHYTIVYKNAQNACFEIDGGVIVPVGDGPYKFEKSLNLFSPALGAVEIGITSYDRFFSTGRIGFTESSHRVSRGKNEYTFVSPSFHSGQPGINNGCTRMDEKDAVRIVKSLQFMNP